MTIERKNVLGFQAWVVWDGEHELCTFNAYHDAVEFILFLESLETIAL